MKKIIILTLVLVSLININVYANQTDELLTDDIKNKIVNVFKNTDINALDLINNLSNGNYNIEYKNIFEYIKKIIINVFKTNLSSFAKLLTVILISSLLRNFSNGDTSYNIICFISNSIIALNALDLFKNISQSIISTIDNIAIFINSLLPILFSFLTTSGNGVSTEALSPVMMTASSALSVFVKSFFVPLTYMNLAFGITGSVTGKKFVEDFGSQIFSFIKWSVGIILTIYIGIISIVGITAPNVDQIVVKSAKLSVGSFVPYVGGILSDTVEVLLSCSNVVKNSIGIVGLIGIVSVVIFPIISNAIKLIFLNILTAFVSPITESRSYKTLQSISQGISILLILVIAVSIMCFISITVILNIGST